MVCVMVFVTETDVAKAIEHVVDRQKCTVADALKLQDALVLGVLIGQVFGKQSACATEIIQDMNEPDRALADEHVVNQVSKHVSGSASPRKDWIRRYCDALNINEDDYKRYKSDVLEHAQVIASKIEADKSSPARLKSERNDEESQNVTKELLRIDANLSRMEDLQKEMSSILGSDRAAKLVDRPTSSSKTIHINVDDIGRNEAFGVIANTIVDATSVPTEAKARIVKVNQRFQVSKAMLENFLGIESSGVDGVLFDYSEATKKNQNDIDRLVSAGVDVNAVREYGEAAIDAAAEVLSGFQSSDVFELQVSGDRHRRRLFVDRLVSRTKKNGLLEFLSIAEFSGETYQEPNVDQRARLKAELVFGLLTNTEFASYNLPSKEIVDFLVQEVFSSTTIEANSLALAWMTQSVDEVFSDADARFENRTALSPDEYDAYKLIVGFWASKDMQLLNRIVARFSRTEGSISTILADTIELVISEVSKTDLTFGIKISQVLQRVRQLRSGMIEANVGVEFFHEVLASLPEDAKAERSRCLYQVSYFYFRMNEPSKSMDAVLKALELNNRDISAMCFRAVLEMHDDRFEIASTLLDEATAVDNSYIFVPFYRGVLHEAEGEFEEAIIEYIRALILAPNFYEAALNLTNCLLDTGRILDASRWASAFLSKYSVPTLEFHTNVAVGLFQAGYSPQALKMLTSVYNETPAPLIALNIGKIYFGRAQVGPCRDWMDKVLASEIATPFERREAREISNLAGKEESVELALSAEIFDVERSEEVGSALGILLSSEYQLASGTNNDLFQAVRRAIQSKPRKAEKFAPKGVRIMMDAEAKKVRDRKLNKQKKRYSEQIKRGKQEAEPKSDGRKRRKTHSKKMPFAGGIVLTRAPSYSAG